MFDSDLEHKEDHAGTTVPGRSAEQASMSAPPNQQRRVFLGASLATLAGLALWQWRKPAALAKAGTSTPGVPQDVTVVLFSDSGGQLKKTTIAKVIKTPDEWRKQLSANAYDITRNADTEMAFSGQYWNLHDQGIYRCICCGNALFDSATKFESGTGWPSFWQPIAAENVTEIHDTAFGMARTAVSCKECDAHLGHVFDDGPQPTGLRYCMNSVSLRFVKRA
ncbi:MAG: peptide-methionine (R)-S-oxide reductase MsrB [Candidatus Sulfotelmatobacter sp.]